MIKRHRLICYAFLELDIDNPEILVDHIDGNKLNNSFINLRLVNKQQINWNRQAKGYSVTKHNRFHARIVFNSKIISLGTYRTETEARQAY